MTILKKYNILQICLFLSKIFIYIKVIRTIRQSERSSALISSDNRSRTAYFARLSCCFTLYKNMTLLKVTFLSVLFHEITAPYTK
jgi:hypothetical protein